MTVHPWNLLCSLWKMTCLQCRRYLYDVACLLLHWFKMCLLSSCFEWSFFPSFLPSSTIISFPSSFLDPICSLCFLSFFFAPSLLSLHLFFFFLPWPNLFTLPWLLSFLSPFFLCTILFTSFLPSFPTFFFLPWSNLFPSSIFLSFLSWPRRTTRGILNSFFSAYADIH